MLKILFMGTPDFARESLKRVTESGYPILGVVTNPDRPKGRGMKMMASPVKEYAIEQSFALYQPEKVKNNLEFIETIKKLNPDVICVVAYGKILPKEILEIPKFGCINVHGSILPKYRGAAPIQWAVLNGDKTTGVTTIYMNEQMDAGDIILSKETEIREDETTGELWNRLSNLGADLLVETLEKLENGTAPRIKQPAEYTIAPMLNKQMAQIDWQQMNAREIKNLVRGLNPIMGAYSFYDGKKIKFWKIETLEEAEEWKQKQPGTILLSDDKKGLYIKAKEGILSIIEIQGENGKRMNVKDFLRGNRLEEEKVFTTKENHDRMMPKEG